MESEKSEEIVETKIHKIVGYCCHCKLMIGELDQEGKKYKCTRCGRKMFKKELLDKVEVRKWKNKQEYLRGKSGYTGSNFHLNKSTTEYPSSRKNNDIKKDIIKENDEEDTLD